MKKIALLLCGFLLTLNVHAQFKTIDKGNTTKADHHGLIPPDSKQNLVASSTNQQTFQPASFVFRKENENGLKVKARSVESRLPIFIEGQPLKKIRKGER